MAYLMDIETDSLRDCVMVITLDRLMVIRLDFLMAMRMEFCWVLMMEYVLDYCLEWLMEYMSAEVLSVNWKDFEKDSSLDVQTDALKVQLMD